jgi:hypothetical protein
MPITQVIDSPIDSSSFFDEMSSVEPTGDTNADGSEVPGAEGEAQEGEEKAPETKEAVVDSKVGESKETVSKSDAADEPSSTEDSPPEKFISAFKGETEVKVPEDAVFKIKVDGKEVEVTLPELQKDYQARVPWNKHYAETKAAAKQNEVLKAELEGQKTHLETWQKSVLDTFKENPFKGFELIVKKMGENPADYLPIFIAQAQKTVQELGKLSEAEYKAYLLQKKTFHEREALDDERKKVDSDKTAAQKQREIHEADVYLGQKAQELQISQAEIDGAIKIAQEAGTDFSRLEPKEVADLIVHYIQNVERPFTRVETIVGGVDKKLLENRELIGELKDLVKPHFTDDFIKEIILKYISDSTPNSQPKTETRAVETKAKGVPAKPQTGGTKAGPARKEEEPKARVEGNDEVGPMSMWDILAEYDR